MKQLIASLSFILVVSFVTASFARSHDGSGEGKVDTSRIPPPLVTLVFDSTGRKVLAERNNKTGKWKVYDIQKALDVLYKGAKNPCPELIVEPEHKPTILERLNGMQPEPFKGDKMPLHLNKMPERPFPSSIPDTIPVIKVKLEQRIRDGGTVVYKDSKGKLYWHHWFDDKVYDRWHNEKGAKVLNVKLDTSNGGKPFPDRPFPRPLPDTTKPRDTLYVPLYERSDTVNVIILYLATDGNVKHMNGKVVSKGIKLQTGQWADQTKVSVIVYDTKFNPVKHRVVDIIQGEFDNKPKTK
jgi:hypothetical protein